MATLVKQTPGYFANYTVIRILVHSLMLCCELW